MTDASTPFTPEAVRAVVAHMNDDHEADTLVICRALGDLPRATGARLTDMGGEGLNIVAEIDGEEQTVTVPWVETPTDRAGIRHEIVRLFETAEERLGAQS